MAKTKNIRIRGACEHNIEIIVDRLTVKPGIEGRLTDSMENIFKLADGLMMVDVAGGGTVVTQGTPEEIAAHPNSYTGKYLKKHLL